MGHQTLHADDNYLWHNVLMHAGNLMRYGRSVWKPMNLYIQLLHLVDAKINKEQSHTSPNSYFGLTQL